MPEMIPLQTRISTESGRTELRLLRETRNPGVKFPYKCNYCGALTEEVTEGNWKGTYHCPECGIYQEYGVF
jgi:transcription elongation factor Elf1